MSTAEIRDDAGADLYPRDRLSGLETALMGFCAAFLGRQDCVWVADAGLTATAVDIDQQRLDEMAARYPAGWMFVCDDLFEYAARRYAEGVTYDLVSLDPPTNLFQEVAGLAGLWCALATRLVVLGGGAGSTMAAPAGWVEVERLHRSTRHGTYWTILEPAA